MRMTLLASGRIAALAASVALLGASAMSPAHAAIEAGVLTCNIASGVGALVMSRKTVACKFRPSSNGPVELYTGSITRLGLDLSDTHAGTMTYGVYSASNGLAPFSLAGSYNGAGAGLTLGNGVGVDALIGGNGSQLTLQPLAFSNLTGVGINAGVGSLNLVAAGTEEPGMHHYRHHHHHPRA